MSLLWQACRFGYRARDPWWLKLDMRVSLPDEKCRTDADTRERADDKQPGRLGLYGFLAHRIGFE